MNFAIVQRATKNTLGVTAEHLDQIARAVTVQLNRDVSFYWGGAHIVRVSSGSDLQSGEIVFALLDELPSAPGDVAYHDVDGRGLPVCFEALSMCSSITSGADSVSCALSHECVEAIGDPACNGWVDDGAGHEVARELADAVESSTYAIDGVDVSDFVLPAFFDPHADGPFSFVAAMGGGNAAGVAGAPRPFGTAVGGYQIQRSSGTGEQSVAAAMHGPRVRACEVGTQRHHEARRRHWSSRSYRRGLR